MSLGKSSIVNAIPNPQPNPQSAIQSSIPNRQCNPQSAILNRQFPDCLVSFNTAIERD
jgi:hypothetical protein